MTTKLKGLLPMGIVDKAKNAAQNASGKVKEQAGKVTGDKDTEAEGKKDQLKANVKKTGENIKDTFR
ncbi:CsbD family protein [Mycolicibacter arupensis]|uniref:CsbD family protein n=1 Tax=Mycolicibacter arupensis TaxID=342002 RepID=UPI003F6D26DD